MEEKAKENNIPNKKGTKYEVGYCKPPIEHRIKPGEVRNPNGRPKRKTIAEHLTDEEIKEIVQQYKDEAKTNPKVLMHLVDQIHGKANQSIDNKIQVEKTLGQLIDELDGINKEPKTETSK
jgi:hypothetical protein